MRYVASKAGWFSRPFLCDFLTELCGGCRNTRCRKWGTTAYMRFTYLIALFFLGACVQ
jgi:hypothetical protein